MYKNFLLHIIDNNTIIGDGTFDVPLAVNPNIIKPERIFYVRTEKTEETKSISNTTQPPIVFFGSIQNPSLYTYLNISEKFNNQNFIIQKCYFGFVFTLKVNNNNGYGNYTVKCNSYVNTNNYQSTGKNLTINNLIENPVFDYIEIQNSNNILDNVFKFSYNIIIQSFPSSNYSLTVSIYNVFAVCK